MRRRMVERLSSFTVFTAHLRSKLLSLDHAPVAQLDRVIGFEPIGREFESLRAHHIDKALHENAGLFLCLKENILRMATARFFD